MSSCGHKTSFIRLSFCEWVSQSGFPELKSPGSRGQLTNTIRTPASRSRTTAAATGPTWFDRSDRERPVLPCRVQTLRAPLARQHHAQGIARDAIVFDRGCVLIEPVGLSVQLFDQPAAIGQTKRRKFRRKCKSFDMEIPPPSGRNENTRDPISAQETGVLSKKIPGLAMIGSGNIAVLNGTVAHWLEHLHDTAEGRPVGR